MTTKNLSVFFGLAFILVGIMGFFDNPIVGMSEGAIFHADQTHNIVHLVSGALFLFFGLAVPRSARTFMVLFGIVYLALGVMGMVQHGGDGTHQLLGFLHVNGNDNYLHIGLGAAILLGAAIARRA